MTISKVRNPISPYSGLSILRSIYRPPRPDDQLLAAAKAEYPKQVARTAGFAVRVFSVGIIVAVLPLAGLHNIEENNEKAECIHLSPVRRGHRIQEGLPGCRRRRLGAEALPTGQSYDHRDEAAVKRRVAEATMSANRKHGASPGFSSLSDGQASNSDPSILKDDDAPAFEVASEIVEIC